MRSVRRSEVSNLLVALVVVIGTSCVPNEWFSCSGGNGGASSGTAATFEYPSASEQGWVDVPLAPLVPALDFTADQFEFVGAVPSGLTLDPATGAIAGTPTEVVTAQTVTVKASNKFGKQRHASVEYTIHPALPPGGFTYAPNPASAPLGDPFPPVVPALSNGASSFSISPALPNGLALDPRTGWIVGVAQGALGVTQHVVTATNPFGDAQTVVELEVLPKLGLSGFVVPSLGDDALDVYALRGRGALPVDLESTANGALACAATPDGRYVYVANGSGRILCYEHDAASGHLAPPVDLGSFGAAWRLATTTDSRHLIVATDNVVTRWEIGVGGALCCPSAAPGPFHPTALAVASNGQVAVASSVPATVQLYDGGTQLAVRGDALSLGATVEIPAIGFSRVGENLLVLTAEYSFSQHDFSGEAIMCELASDVELAAGAPALDVTELRKFGRQFSDLSLEHTAGTVRAWIADRTEGEVHALGLGAGDTVLGPTLVTHAVGGAPAKLLAANGGLFLLDDVNGELEFWESNGATLDEVTSAPTRSQPVALVALNGANPGRARVAFVASESDSTLRAVKSQTSGDLLVPSTQGPLATDTAPVDVATSAGLPFVFTANRDGDSLGIYAWDDAAFGFQSGQNHALAPNAAPFGLALAPGGSHLFALEAAGGIESFRVDPNDGSLTPIGFEPLSGSLAGAKLRVDPLLRFVYVVQPDAGTVHSFRFTLANGSITPSMELTSLGRPTDVFVSPEGRFVHVLDEASGTIRRCIVDRVSGELQPVGSFGGAATAVRLVEGSALPSADASGRVFALDPAANGGVALARDPASGFLTSGANATFTLAPSSSAFGVLAFSVDGLIVADDDGANGRLRSYFAASTNGPLVEQDVELLGRGPFALATRP
ncbi:MAG: beta-propeller fold lactonase family protein [Planctomycetes bacterium]|nr:beta-propeller fold lactonase family protein [Planctomycetota bacterium]